MNLLSQIVDLNFPAPLPERLLAVRQEFDAPRVRDIPGEVRRALIEGGITAQMTPGDSVAVGVGSRGLANLPALVAATVATLREAGMDPFIVPAMGSHGGATPEGQVQVLADLGVTEASAGAAIRASMEVAEIGRIPDGPPLYQGEDSQAADHTVLISRIKPHTDFRSHLESGPAKMAVIGLGKQHGASLMHAGGGRNFQRYLQPAARVYETHSNLRGAVCVVENAHEETAVISGLTAAQIGGEAEAKLLKRAKEYLPRLPFDAVDVLVVQRMGKEISGTGMDTNVISRLWIPRQPEGFGPTDVGVIVTLSLTEATHGNATGVGLANIITARLARQIDWAMTYTNAITSGIFGMQRVHLPMTLPDDERALQVALRCCAVPPEEARMVFIRDTLSLAHFYVSPNLRRDVEAHPRLTVVGEVPLSFVDGQMTEPWQF